MARLAVTPKSTGSSYPALPLVAGSQDFTWTPAGADFADGASFPMTGKEILLVKGGAGPQTVTISSVRDPYNRTGDITTYAVGAGLFVVFPFLAKDGWAQTSGLLYFAASAADVSFAVLRIP